MYPKNWKSMDGDPGDYGCGAFCSGCWVCQPTRDDLDGDPSKLEFRTYYDSDNANYWGLYRNLERKKTMPTKNDYRFDPDISRKNEKESNMWKPSKERNSKTKKTTVKVSVPDFSTSEVDNQHIGLTITKATDPIEMGEVLGSLFPGETFRYRSQANIENIYSVIDISVINKYINPETYKLSKYELDKIVFVVHLGTGKLFKGLKTASVVRVKGTLSYADVV